MIDDVNENDLNPQGPAVYAAVEEALRTVELVDASPTLAPGIIRQLHSRPQLPRFRLLWIDYVLSLFVAGILVLIYIVGGALPPELRLYLRLQLLYWLQRLELDPLLPVLALGGVLLAVLGIILLGMLVRQLFSREEV